MKVNQSHKCILCGRGIASTDKVPVIVEHYNKKILYNAHTKCREIAIERRERRGETITTKKIRRRGEALVIGGNDV